MQSMSGIPRCWHAHHWSAFRVFSNASRVLMVPQALLAGRADAAAQTAPAVCLLQCCRRWVLQHPSERRSPGADDRNPAPPPQRTPPRSRPGSAQSPGHQPSHFPLAQQGFGAGSLASSAQAQPRGWVARSAGRSAPHAWQAAGAGPARPQQEPTLPRHLQAAHSHIASQAQACSQERLWGPIYPPPAAPASRLAVA